MKKTMLLSFIFVFSLLVTACNDDDDDDNDPSNPNTPSNADPAFEAIISGALTDTLAFTVPGGIMTDYAFNGSYLGVTESININVLELPTGYQFGIIGNRDSFGNGDYVSNGTLGYGSYTDNDLGRAFLGTSSTVTISSSELVQNVIQATYNVTGSFSITMEDTSTPPQVIQINGTFENMTLSVN